MLLTRKDATMTNFDDNSVFDRELFSELTESPILPFLIHMVPPCKQGHDSNFYLQINGKALWLWRKAGGKSNTAFNVLQVCLRKLGYELNGSCSERVGGQIATRVRHFLKQLEIAKGRKRQRIKAETWVNIAIFPTEVHLHPFHTLVNHRSKEAELTNINNQLRSIVEEQAAELYKKMDNALSENRKRRDFTNAGERQQRPILSEVE